MLLSVFMVSVLHNIVHLFVRRCRYRRGAYYGAARTYLLAGGAIYLVLWIYGLVIDQRSSANFVPVNTADNWLHLGLGVVMIGLALVLGRRRDASVPTGP